MSTNPTGAIGLVERYEDELRSLASATATGPAAEIAGAACALLVRFLSGSSIAASAAQKVASKLFGEWFADNPDERLRTAAAAFAERDHKCGELREFAELVYPVLMYGLRAVESSLSRIESGYQHSQARESTRSDDLESLIGQSLRATALLEYGQGEIKALLDQVRGMLLLTATTPVGDRGPATTNRLETISRRSTTQQQIKRRFEFFVSYAEPDEPWAEWIAWALEAAKYRVKLQKWDIRPGKNFVLEIQVATIQAERTIAILSPAYFDSPLACAEWAVAFGRDPTGTEGTLLPVRVVNCRPAGLLGPVVYIDLYGIDEDRAHALLLDGVKRGRAKPRRSPSFPGQHASPIGPSTIARPVFPGATPAGSTE